MKYRPKSFTVNAWNVGALVDMHPDDRPQAINIAQFQLKLQIGARTIAMDGKFAEREDWVVQEPNGEFTLANAALFNTTYEAA